MSFEVNCPNCGASSGPSVGVCPYCKTVLSTTEVSCPVTTGIQDLYAKGHIEEALAQVHVIKDNEAQEGDPIFLMLAGKLSLEAESPSSQIKTFFAKALAIEGAHQKEAKLYLDMVTAKGMFRKGLNDPGEKWFNSQIPLFPNNPHLLFLLGSHTFWVDQETRNSAANLERCVQIRPTLARAWGCLFAIYQKLKDKPNMKRCIGKYAEISSDERTVAFMNEQYERT